MQVRLSLLASILFSVAPVLAQDVSVVQPTARRPLAPAAVAPVPANPTNQGTPAYIELKNGTQIIGSMMSEGPIPCATALGTIEIPLSSIRGIKWQKSDAREATLILTNDDSLTVVVNAPHLPIKTDWGIANVKLSHIQSMIFSVDKFKWAEITNGRPALETAERKTSSAELSR